MNRKLILLLFFGILFAGRVDICIDPGHGGTDPGAVNNNYGANGPYEKDFNLDIAWIMQDDLVWALNYTVSMTRFSDESVSLQDRANMANGIIENPYSGNCDTCDYFVSVHNNGSEYDTTRGTMTLYWKSADEYYANNIHTHMWNYISNLPYAKDLGVRRRGPYVLRKTESPACLTESGYVTHDIATNAQWFQLKENQGSFKHKVAWGIDNGLDDYFEFDRPGWLRVIMVPGSRSTISLNWKPCPQNVIGYNVYRRTHPNEEYIIIASTVPDTAYNDNSVVGGTTYSYYVKGVRSSGQIGNRSNIVSAQVIPFISDNSHATGENNTPRIAVCDSSCYVAWTNDDQMWYTKSTNNGTSWSFSRDISFGWQPSLVVDPLAEVHACCLGDLGVPDSAAQEPKTYTLNYLHEDNDIWSEFTLYETYDSILGLSFTADQLDTGWVAFNVYDDVGNNNLLIGQFHLQSDPDSLDNVTLLDTYIRHGLASIVVRESDRSVWIVYERNNTILCKWRNNSGEWDSLIIAGNGSNPCISKYDDNIHIIWEQYFENSAQGQIRYIYNDGSGWSRIQTISTVSGRNCYPYIASGTVAVWSDIYQGQLDIFASQRTEYGTWTQPQNISQTSDGSKYAQAAIKQTAMDTNIIYIWTEGNELPYEVKIHSASEGYSVEKRLSNTYILLSNPIRDMLNIRYNSTTKEIAIAKLYDTTGRFVDTIFDREINEGWNEFSYNCRHLSNGVYFVKFEINKQIITEKVIIHR